MSEVRSQNSERNAAFRWAAPMALGLAVALLVALLPYAAGYGSFRRTMLQVLWDAWFDPQDTTWQHGALVPFIVGYLVWQKREKWAAISPRPTGWGLALVLFSLALYFVGFKANNHYFGALALQLLPMGAIVWLWGWARFRLILFPWTLLAFMWPARFLEDTLGFQLRFVMVRCVATVLQWIHAPVWKDGTTFWSAPVNGQAEGAWLKLNVDGPCSGMRTLFALMLVSALFAHARQRSWTRRVALFACSIPLAILGNMVRLFLLIGGSAVMGQSIAVGNESTEVTTFHFLAGVAVFVVAVAGMQGISAVMNRFLPKPSHSERSDTGIDFTLPMEWTKPALLLTLSIATLLACYYSPPVKSGDAAGVVMELPLRIPSFVGQPEKPQAEELRLLPEDTAIARMRYCTAAMEANTGDFAEVSLVLAGAERRSIHRPEVCLPGQGWSIVGSEVVKVEIAEGQFLRVKDLSIEKTAHRPTGEEYPVRAHFVYWFIGTDITTPSHFERIMRTTWDSIFRNVNHRWAYASITTLVTENLDSKETHQRHRTDEETKRLTSFLIQQLVPRVQKGFTPHPVAKS